VSLLDDLKDMPHFQNKIVRCSLCITLLALPEEEKVALQESVANKSLTAVSIVRVLKIHGFHVTDQAVWKHRHGECPSASL
jgi:hypothetical protein